MAVEVSLDFFFSPTSFFPNILRAERVFVHTVLVEYTVHLWSVHYQQLLFKAER